MSILEIKEQEKEIRTQIIATKEDIVSSKQHLYDLEDEEKSLSVKKEESYKTLKNNILELFIGVKPSVKVDWFGVNIRVVKPASLDEVYVLDYLYDDHSFEMISRELAYKIKEMYDTECGIPEKEIDYNIPNLSSGTVQVLKNLMTAKSK